MLIYESLARVNNCRKHILKGQIISLLTFQWSLSILTSTFLYDNSAIYVSEQKRYHSLQTDEWNVWWVAAISAGISDSPPSALKNYVVSINYNEQTGILPQMSQSFLLSGGIFFRAHLNWKVKAWKYLYRMRYHAREYILLFLYCTQVEFRPLTASPAYQRFRDVASKGAPYSRCFTHRRGIVHQRHGLLPPYEVLRSLLIASWLSFLELYWNKIPWESASGSNFLKINLPTQRCASLARSGFTHSSCLAQTGPLVLAFAPLDAPLTKPYTYTQVLRIMCCNKSCPGHHITSNALCNWAKKRGQRGRDRERRGQQLLTWRLCRTKSPIIFSTIYQGSDKRILARGILLWSASSFCLRFPTCHCAESRRCVVYSITSGYIYNIISGRNA